MLVRDLPRQQQLLLEPPLEVDADPGVRQHLGPDDLQGDRNAELLILGLVHGAHAAHAEQPFDPVPAGEEHAGTEAAARPDKMRVTSSDGLGAGVIAPVISPPSDADSSAEQAIQRPVVSGVSVRHCGQTIGFAAAGAAGTAGGGHYPAETDPNPSTTNGSRRSPEQRPCAE